MAAMSDQLEILVMDYIFHLQAFTQPTNLYIALCTGTITDAMSATLSGANEVGAGVGYSRQLLAASANATNWGPFPTTSTGTLTNKLAITFGPNTTTNWGTIASVAIVSSGPTTGTAGTLYFYGSLTTPRLVTVNDTLTFAADALSVQIDN